MVFGSTPIYAKTSLDYFDEVEGQLKDSVKIENRNTIHEFTLDSKSKIGKDITIHVDKENLKFEQATLVKYIDSETQQVLFINNIPISIEDSHELSNIAVIYDEKGNMIHYTELYLTKNNQGNFNVKSYMNGQKVAEEDTNEKFMTAEEYVEQLKEGPELFFNANKLAMCLGISLAVANTIGLVCTAACFVSAGMGCIVCASTAAGFAVGGNSSCIVAAFLG